MSIADRLRAVASLDAQVAGLRAVADALVPPDPDTDPPPPVIVHGDYTEYLKVSGTPNGTTGYWFNRVGNLRWENRGGDWLDLNGTKQGDVPITAAVITSTTVSPWQEIDVLPFMSRWMSVVSDGLLLRCPSNFQVESHASADATRHSHIVVITEVGTYTCPVLADAGLGLTHSDSQINAQLSDTPINAGSNGVFRYDVSGVVGTPITATLRLWKRSTPTGAVLSAYRIDTPLPFDARGLPVVHGISHAYADNDLAGLAAHPDVFNASDFPPTWRTDPNKWHKENGAVVRATLPHPSVQAEDGTWWLYCAFPVNPACDGTGDGGAIACTMPLAIVPMALGPPYPTTALGPESMYARYSIKLHPTDWLTAPGDTWFTGGKFPGFSLRFGYPKSRVAQPGLPVQTDGRYYYWESTSGNGGSPAPGKLRAGSSVPLLLQGGSARGAFSGDRLRDPLEVNNPMISTCPIGSYMYWIDDTDTGTSNWWRNAQLVHGREYDIEQYVQLNTIDMSAPDEFGNGVANFDGVFRAWVNGILVEEITNRRWRHHPALGIDEFWLDILNGGVQAPCRKHSFWVGPLVISRSYIGPRKGVSGGLA